MEKIIISVSDGECFIAHILSEPDRKMYHHGTLYFAQRYQSSDGKTAVEYTDGHSNGSPEPNEDTKIAFEFSFTWRGVWEGRIYFKEAEYWSSDLDSMNNAWNELENILKEKIKRDNPDYKYFD